VIRADAGELAAHQRRLEAIEKSAGSAAVWRQLDADTP